MGHVAGCGEQGLGLTSWHCPYLHPQPRLKCLFHIVKQLTAEDEAFITALVPEVRGAGLRSSSWIRFWLGLVEAPALEPDA